MCASLCVCEEVKREGGETTHTHTTLVFFLKMTNDYKFVSPYQSIV